MQKDFHYCLIRILAQKAGFERGEAQVIAYASQYVDDSVEHERIRIRNVPKLDYPRLQMDGKHGSFDPICTAHRGISYLSGISKSAQMKVYIPFHFIPASEYGGGEYDYCTVPSGKIAGDLVRQAIAELKEAAGEERLRKLIKLGIALHSYADTWAHQKFSGRWSVLDNNIERLALFQEETWESLAHFDQLKLNLLPEIGHAEAMTYPDQSHLRWRYEHDHSGIDYERDNTMIFLEAAHAVYLLLCEATGKRAEWKELVGKITGCLSLPTDSIKRKFALYVEQFPDITFTYHENEWRSLALKGESLNWLDFTEEDYAGVEYAFKGGDRKWFYFHMEALAQREYVKGRIKANLL